LKVLGRTGRKFEFEMNMGSAVIEELHASILDLDATILNVGNPQCAVFVENFDLDWRGLGATLERHARFPNRTNVSFINVLDGHTLDVRFFERGAGETMSSGTGSTGAAAAAYARGLVQSPVRVMTPAGPLDLRWEREDLLLAGPAEIVASGEFYWDA
jgi:diaminopimelate epimerase